MRVSMVAALTLAAAVTFPTASVATELFYPDQLEGLTVQNGTVLWHSGCGEESSVSKLREKPSSAAAGSSGATTLFGPVDCLGSSQSGIAQSIASANVATDGTYAYWLGARGSVLRVPLSGGAPQQISHTTVSSVGGFPSCCSIAVDATYVYWSEGSRIFRAPTGAITPAGELVASGSNIRDLRVAANGSLYYLSGTTLMVAQPPAFTGPHIPGSPASGPAYVSARFALNVSAYALDSSRVYWAAEIGGAYAISAQLYAGGGVQSRYTSGATDATVESLAVAGADLYWHVKHSNGSGPLYRLPFGGTAIPITGDIVSATPLATDGTYLFWPDYNVGVQRLNLYASAASTSRGSVRITGVEVVQSIQTKENMIPLVGYKPTIVRVFVQSTSDTNGPWTGVTATLSVSGSSRLHGSIPITVSTNGSDYRSTADSFTFALDRDETAPGTRTIAVRVFPPAGRPQGSTAGNQLSQVLTFGPERLMTIWGWTYANLNNGCSSDQIARYGQPGASGYEPPFSDFEAHREYVEAAWPVSEVSLLELPGSGTESFDNSDCATALNDARSAIQQILGSYFPANYTGGQFGGIARAVLLQPDNYTSGMCCFGDQAGDEAVNVSDTQPSSGAGQTAAQELAHSFGGRLWTHTWQPDTHYPRTDGNVGSRCDGPIGPYVGVRVLPSFTLEPGDSADTSMPCAGQGAQTPAAWDFMSYHITSEWASPYTYCALLGLMSSNAVTCPTSVEGGGMVSSNLERPRPPAGLLAFNNRSPSMIAQASSSANYLYVSGVVGQNGEIATFYPAEVVPSGVNLVVPARAKTYSVVLLDAQGRSLGSYPFGVSPVHVHPDKEGTMASAEPQFGLYVPWDSATARILIQSSGKTLAERVVNPRAPEVKFAGPAPGSTMLGKHVFSWSASTEDKAILSYSLWYSRNGGQTWMPLAVKLGAPTITVDFDRLPSSDAALLRVLASNGVTTTEARSAGPFRVQRKAPQLTLAGPKDGSIVDGHREFVVRASAFSFDDGPLAASAYRWSDERNVLLGNGSWIVPQLAPGPHTLSVTVIDAVGMKSTASLHLTVLGEKSPLKQ